MAKMLLLPFPNSGKQDAAASIILLALLFLHQPRKTHQLNLGKWTQPKTLWIKSGPNQHLCSTNFSLSEMVFAIANY